MPKPTVATPSLDTLVQEPASRTVAQTADSILLVSFGLLALLIIGVFFGIGFSLITAQSEEQISVGSAARDRSEVNPPRSAALHDPPSDAPSTPIELELSGSSGAASLPVAPVVQAPALAAAPSRDAASVTGATDAPFNPGAAGQATLQPPAIGSPQEVASGPPAATASAAPPTSPRSSAEVAELRARGDSFVLVGDIASARVFYQRAADAGDARGALRMGATFDPAFLSRAGLDSASGDPAEARSWYYRALDLRPAEAGRRHKRVATK